MELWHVLWKRYKKVYVRDYHSLFEIHGGSQIKENATEQMSQALVHISDKLGYTTEKVFEIYTQAQQAQAAANIITLFTGLVLFGLMMYFAVKKIRSSGLRGEDREVAYLVATGFSIMATVLIADVLHTMILQLVAPEYMAVQEIMAQVGEVIG